MLNELCAHVQEAAAPLFEPILSPKPSAVLRSGIDEATYVYQCNIGEVATRALQSSTALFMALEAAVHFGKEVFLEPFQGSFHPLTVFFAAIFSTYYGVKGLKMIFDGGSKIKECVRTGNRYEGSVAGVQMLQGALMLAVGALSAILSLIHFHDLFSLNSPLQGVSTFLVGASSFMWGLYSLAEVIGSFREWRRHVNMEKELRNALGPRGDDFERGLAFLQERARISECERQEVLAKTTTPEHAKRELIRLAASKETVFASCFWRSNLLLVKGAQRADAKKVVQACFKFNRMLKWLSFANCLLFGASLLAIAACFVFTGGLPVIAGTLIIGVASVVSALIHLAKAHVEWESKEVGRWDVVILVVSMVFFVATMVVAAFLPGIGTIPLIVIGVTGALVLTIKATSLIRLHLLIKKRQNEVRQYGNKPALYRNELKVSNFICTSGRARDTKTLRGKGRFYIGRAISCAF